MHDPINNTEEELKLWSVIRILPKFRFLEDNIQTCSTASHRNNFPCLYTIKYIVIFTDWNLPEESQYGHRINYIFTHYNYHAKYFLKFISSKMILF